ncbi:MAG: hypothetical protein RLZZ223_319 [Candidatus Parcubacteria bacterium]|jgi:hypothetical protein
MEDHDLSNCFLPRRVSKMTRLKYVLLLVGVLGFMVYTPTMANSNSHIVNNIIKSLSAPTFPSPDNPKAKCYLMRQKNWYQRWGPCWQ